MSAERKYNDHELEVPSCPRCGKDHPRCFFEELTSPVSIPIGPAVDRVVRTERSGDSNDCDVIETVPPPLTHLTHYALCPVTSEPILMRIIGEGEVEVR